MERYQLNYLTEWLGRENRKPLLIRGARQVGKSFLVRELAKRAGLNLMEINLEHSPELASMVLEKDPAIKKKLLENHFKISLSNTAQKPLLFLDELQATPKLIPELRYFYEKMPELPVIGAGSLLDFALSEAEYSMPVGRIENIFMGPLSFEEFLLAQKENQLLDWMKDFEFGKPWPELIHRKLMNWLKTYYLVGGMPEVVDQFTKGPDYSTVDRLQKNLITVYQDDFNKYRKRIPSERLRKVFRAIPGLVGKKFVYAQIDSDERPSTISHALDLLCQARIAYPVKHSSGNGVPLAAEASSKYFKTLFLDVGLMSSSLGLTFPELMELGDFTLIHQGAVSEQFIGQHLLSLGPIYQEPELFMWAREKANAMAEVDYLISKGLKIIPIEVKAGKSGKLKSLQVFVSEKGSNLALRFSSEIPSVDQVSLSLPGAKEKNFTLISLPLYMVGETLRMIESLDTKTPPPS